MHAQPEVSLRFEEHLLAHGLHAHGLTSVEHRGALGEASLRAGGAHRLADEVAIELPRDAVDGMLQEGIARSYSGNVTVIWDSEV